MLMRRPSIEELRELRTPRNAVHRNFYNDLRDQMQVLRIIPTTVTVGGTTSSIFRLGVSTLGGPDVLGGGRTY
jgi:hypothetical protein